MAYVKNAFLFSMPCASPLPAVARRPMPATITRIKKTTPAIKISLGKRLETNSEIVQTPVFWQESGQALLIET